MGHSDLSEISRIQRIKTDQYLITDFNPDSYRDLIRYICVYAVTRNVPSAFYSFEFKMGHKI